MKPLIFAALIFVSVGRAQEDGWSEDLRKDQQAVEQLAREAEVPGITREAAAEIERQRLESVKRIGTIADTRPDNPAAQLAVGKSLASVEEAPRAIPYAERGLALAETSGDPKLVREALLTGSEVYAKAGRYDLARERAERVLKTNPRDKDALALYMQVKGRGTASAASPAGGKTTGSSGAAGSASAGAATTAAPGVAMTSPASLEAQKQIALGWSRIKLDPAAALKNFEAAITADPTSAAVRVQRSKARLEAGDSPGALGDAEDAVRLDPRLGEAYAARAEAKRSLGRAEAEFVSDYEAAANLDGRFTEAYKAVAARLSAAPAGNASGANTDATAAGRSAPDGPLGLLAKSPKKWGMIALLCVLAALAGGLFAPLLLKKRRSPDEGAPTPTPRP